MSLEETMSNNSKQARARGEALFPREARDNAMAEYKAEAQAVRDRTAKLRELRLAKEAAEQELAAAEKPKTGRRARARR
jgi:hypothetical protein